MNYDDLKAKGWTKNTDGSWSKPRRPVGGLEAHQPERAPAPALDGRRQERQGGAKGVVGCRYLVTIVAVRARLLDDDNNVGSVKPLRDAIAASLGMDDGDWSVEWVVGQAKCAGKEGCFVSVEVL